MLSPSGGGPDARVFRRHMDATGSVVVARPQLPAALTTSGITRAVLVKGSKGFDRAYPSELHLQGSNLQGVRSHRKGFMVGGSMDDA